ncbi:uncharacterized protein KGF55_001942 [Candida pseudojiufengensis]|uniref:uncharacterized protein n=1 Tax=Candida pseudojiufengensis TaxID=497109 RepID=UPI0022244DF5|nr:uncharacterized protein KGF55_001942 [Candida pseudojiufengensis]KAI5964871.1 hypothetical protein KGF55_001942 [Candida pseudojiufengensis]
MSFKFPSFDLKSIQDSLPTVDQFKETFSKVTPSNATIDQFKESIQLTTAKINDQLKQVQNLATTNNNNIEVSELPQDYLQLEINCDLLLKLYTDLITFTNDTYNNVSYDYPPGNYTINKIKDAHVGDLITSKFNQLKNVSSPQELEKVLLGTNEEPKADITIQPTSPDLPKTLFGHLSEILSKHSQDLTKQSTQSDEVNSSKLSFILMQISSTYHEIGSSRLEQDQKILQNLNHELVDILNKQFIKVNELRKKVYLTRSQFDQLRFKYETSDPENEELISKEDELVGATELAVIEMKKILNPSKNINLLKVLVQAQKEYYEFGAKKLSDLLTNLDKVSKEVEKEDDE